MNKIILLLILLIISLTNCTGYHSYQYTRISYNYPEKPQKIQIFVDKSFSDLDKLAIEDSINQWNYALNGLIILRAKTYYFNLYDLDQEDGFYVIKVPGDDVFIPRNFKNGKELYTLAWVNEVSYGNKIWVVRDRMFSSDQLFGVMLHEFGHLLGASHVKDEYVSLMNEQYSEKGYSCIDHHTIKQIAKLHYLSESKINYCTHKY